MYRTNGHTNPGKDHTTSQYIRHLYAKGGLRRLVLEQPSSLQRLKEKSSQVSQIPEYPHPAVSHSSGAAFVIPSSSDDGGLPSHSLLVPCRGWYGICNINFGIFSCSCEIKYLFHSHSVSPTLNANGTVNYIKTRFISKRGTVNYRTK